MVKSRWWLLLSLAWVGVGVASVFPLVMLSMAFDAPGSEKNMWLIAAVGSMAFFPISCLLGAVLPWLFRRWRFALTLFGVPVLNAVLSGLLLWLMLQLGIMH